MRLFMRRFVITGCIFFTVDEEYQLLSTMKEFAAKLADYHFICCSSSFCINMKYVTDFQKDIITLNDKTELKSQPIEEKKRGKKGIT